MNVFKVSIIVPSFNEEHNVSVLSARLEVILESIGADYELIFIDDGSYDNTLFVLEHLAQHNPRIHYLSFSRNFGHQAAVKAGLDYSSGDCIISMDADMQHPPELIPQMIHYWQQGIDIVYTRRMPEENLPLFKKITSSLFYKVLNNLSDTPLEEGCADFRLLDRKVADILKNLPEKDLFLRGLVRWVGFSQQAIDYIPNPRLSGKSKYSLRKMVQLAISGITSFSIKPLRMAIWMGFAISFIGFVYALYALYGYFFTDRNLPGWTSVAVGILFIGGLQLLILGIIGEYIGKIFLQVKQRPVYIVNKSNLSPSPQTQPDFHKDFRL
jgi:glycosyltransferase involved in cell wall biosynthesis